LEANQHFKKFLDDIILKFIAFFTLQKLKFLKISEVVKILGISVLIQEFQEFLLIFRNFYSYRNFEKISEVGIFRNFKK
jgi:hypothetical protein